MTSGARHITRREAVERIERAVAPLYDEREARNIALWAVSELAGVSLSALRIDSAAECRIDDFDRVVRELSEGHPLQYVLGATEFYGRRFAVREGVLIPRPETEELVEWIVRSSGTARSVLDVGTGSGCIAATLAAELPEAKLFAADISEEALAVAAENCRALGVDVTLRRADALNNLAEVFSEKFDVVVSNPPYVPDSDRATMHTNVLDHEPALALFVPDGDPLRFYRAIARAARRMLAPEGRLYFEIYHLYAREMVGMLREEGFETEVREDLTGKPRMTCSKIR